MAPPLVSSSASPPPLAWPRRVAVPVTLVLASLGGALFWLLHIPLAWMLGAMTFTGMLAWNDRAAVLQPTRPAALIFLGLGLGQTFTPQVMAAVGMALPWLILGGLLSILAGALTARIFARLAGTDSGTGYYASVPGGVILMVVLAQRARVSVPAVTLAQTIRVLVVVAFVPPLVTLLAPHGDAAAFMAERPAVHYPGLGLMVAGGLAVSLLIARTGLANPWMLGPCAMVILLSAFGHLPSGVPVWMVDAAQIGMGMTLGTRLSRRFLLSLRRLAIASVLTTLALVVIMAVMALPVAWLSGLPAAAAVLGLAPGGMPEMTITAKALELAVPLVLGFHLVRMLMCNLMVAPIWKLALRLGLTR